MSKTVTIREDFRHAINSGKLLPGDRLPTQDEIAENYNTVTSTVARSLKPLKASGIIYTTSDGTFVGPRPQWETFPFHDIPQVIACQRDRCRNTFEVGRWHGVETFRSAIVKAGWTPHYSPRKVTFFCHQCSKEQ